MNTVLIPDMRKIGIDYNSFKNMFISQIENPNKSDEKEMKYWEYRKINFQRSHRLEKHFIPSDELLQVIKTINRPQTWVVITESWCGDSAQNLPIISTIASRNDKIILRIVFRDEHIELMDQYLTNGTRSIPKLIVFDNDNNELFQWGPRPLEAQSLYINLKNTGIEKSEINKELHYWYSKNRGKEVEKELIELIKKLN